MVCLVCPVQCPVSGQDAPDWTLLQNSFVIFSFPYPFMVLCYCSTHLLLFSYMNNFSIHVLSAVSQKEEIYLARFLRFEESPLVFGILLSVCIFQLPYIFSYMKSTESCSMLLHYNFHGKSGKKLGFKSKGYF